MLLAEVLFALCCADAGRIAGVWVLLAGAPAPDGGSAAPSWEDARACGELARGLRDLPATVPSATLQFVDAMFLRTCGRPLPRACSALTVRDIFCGVSGAADGALAAGLLRQPRIMALPRGDAGALERAVRAAVDELQQGGGADGGSHAVLDA